MSAQLQSKLEAARWRSCLRLGPRALSLSASAHGADCSRLRVSTPVVARCRRTRRLKLPASRRHSSRRSCLPWWRTARSASTTTLQRTYRHERSRWTSVTVRSLLNHTSGLPDFVEDGAIADAWRSDAEFDWRLDELAAATSTRDARDHTTDDLTVRGDSS